MYLGKLVEVGETSTLITQPKHPYTEALMSAVALPDPELREMRKRIVLEGEIPSSRIRLRVVHSIHVAVTGMNVVLMNRLLFASIRMTFIWWRAIFLIGWEPLVPPNDESMSTNYSSSPPLGGSVVRTDSFNKVTGKTNYVEDFKIPGLLHIKVLRSPYHHARLRSLNVTRAAQMPGVRRIITWADIPNVNGFPSYSLEEPVLTPVGDTLRMRQHRLPWLSLKSVEQAQAALAAVEMELEQLPYTFETEEALKPGALHIAGDANVLSKSR